MNFVSTQQVPNVMHELSSNSGIIYLESLNKVTTEQEI